MSFFYRTFVSFSRKVIKYYSIPSFILGMYNSNNPKQSLAPYVYGNDPLLNTLLQIVIGLLLLYGIEIVIHTLPIKKWLNLKKTKIIEYKGYGYAIKVLHKTYALIQLHKLKNRINDVDTTKELIKETLDDIRVIYEHRTKSKCSVSIKLIENTNNLDDEVYHILRDFKTESEKKRDFQIYKKYKHKIIENTCFEEIIRKKSQGVKKLYYLNQDLPSDIEYENSTLNMFKKEMKFAFSDPKNIKKRRQEWPLKYRSEIVLPIIPSVDSEDWFLLEFLCLDSDKEKNTIFNENYDIPLLQAYINSIYDLIFHNFESLYKIAVIK